MEGRHIWVEEERGNEGSKERKVEEEGRRMDWREGRREREGGKGGCVSTEAEGGKRMCVLGRRRRKKKTRPGWKGYVRRGGGGGGGGEGRDSESGTMKIK